MSFITVIAGVIIYILWLGFAAAREGQDAVFSPEEFEAVVNMPLLTLIACSLTFFILWLIFHREWTTENFWKGSKNIFIVSALCAVLAIPLGMFTDVTLYLMRIREFLPWHDEMPSILSVNNLFLGIAATGIAAPMVHEVIFRGIVLRRLLETPMKIPVAVFLQALMFAFIHFDMANGASAFILGIALGVIYVKFRSIWPVIAVHITYDLGVIIQANFLCDVGLCWCVWDDISGGVLTIISVVSLLILTLLLGLIMRMKKEVSH